MATFDFMFMHIIQKVKKNRLSISVQARNHIYPQLMRKDDLTLFDLYWPLREYQCWAHMWPAEECMISQVQSNNIG